jgi:anti-sigma B factor antagonist
MALSINLTRDATGALFDVIGEVDVSNAAELRDALDNQLQQAPSSIEMNLSHVPYIDSTGIGVLVAFAHKAQEAGSSFVVSHPQHNVARVLSLLDVADKLGVSGRSD